MTQPKNTNRGAGRARADSPKAAATKTLPPVEQRAGVGLSVVARSSGFRRAGFAFSDEPTVIPLTELTDEQYEQLNGERQLVCAFVQLESEADKARQEGNAPA